MGLFDRDKPKKEPVKKEKADFSNVQSGSSSTAPEARPAGAQTYTVKAGDTLWAISERFYGEGSQWSRIHEANRGLIQDPDLIQPGWVLTIPAGEAEGGAR